MGYWPPGRQKHKEQQSQWATEAGRDHNGPRLTRDVPVVSASSPPALRLFPLHCHSALLKLGGSWAGGGRARFKWPPAGSPEGGVHPSPQAEATLPISLGSYTHSPNKQSLGTHDVLCPCPALGVGLASRAKHTSGMSHKGVLGPWVGQILLGQGTALASPSLQERLGVLLVHHLLRPKLNFPHMLI